MQNVDPDKIKEYLSRYNHTGDMDDKYDLPGMVAELSKYCDSLIDIAVDNRSDNAVITLNKIVTKLGGYVAVYKMLYPEYVLQEINDIIAKTYGKLK